MRDEVASKIAVCCRLEIYFPMPTCTWQHTGLVSEFALYRNVMVIHIDLHGDHRLSVKLHYGLVVYILVLVQPARHLRATHLDLFPRDPRAAFVLTRWRLRRRCMR